MEQKRRGRINKINVDLRQMRYTVERLISQRQMLNPSIKSHVSKINEIQEKIEEKNIQIENLNSVIIKIKKGEYDDDILSEYNENMIKQQEIRNIIKDKKIEKKTKKEIQYSNIKKHNREYYRDTNISRYMKSDLNRFKRNLTNFPSNLTNKLFKMSFNMGYEWRNTYFFGRQLCHNKNNLTIFQKEGNKLFTHIYNVNNDYTVSYNKREKTLY
jgi:flagellar hook-associated protein FlgK